MNLELGLYKAHFPGSRTSWLPLRFCQWETELRGCLAGKQNIGREEKGLPTSFLVSVDITPEVPAVVGGSAICAVSLTEPRHGSHRAPAGPAPGGPQCQQQGTCSAEGQAWKDPFPSSWVQRRHFSLLSSQPRVVTASCN